MVSHLVVVTLERMCRSEKIFELRYLMKVCTIDYEEKRGQMLKYEFIRCIKNGGKEKNLNLCIEEKPLIVSRTTLRRITRFFFFGGGEDCMCEVKMEGEIFKKETEE